MQRKATKLLSVLLVIAMMLSMVAVLPMSALAAETAEKLNTYETESSTLAPGVTQTVNYAYRDDGKYVKYYYAIADLSNPDVGVHATYGGAQGTVPGVTKMTEQVADMTKLHANPDDAANYIENYAIVAGVNGDGYNTTTGAPSGAHVMNGVSGFGIVKAGNSPWFAYFEDGTAACGRNNTDWDAAVAAHGAVKEAIGGFQLLMKDGKVYEPGTGVNQGGGTYWRPGFNYPCSFLGVTNDNKLVLLNCDGNNAGGSAGFDYDYTMEVAQELGLKDLLCLDGGGSATYLCRPEGEKDVIVLSNPSDGAERAVANGLVVYTTTPPSDVFDRANLETGSKHYTPYSEIKVEASGVSPAGTPAEIPENVEWALSDSAFGSIENGVFISNGKLGTVEIQMLYAGKVVGKVDVDIVNPTAISFTQDTMVVPFGKTATVSIEASYYDAEHKVTLPVEIKASDFDFSFSAQKTGSMDGFVLKAPAEGSASKTTLTATYKHAILPAFSIAVSYGKASEIIWDFEDGDISNWMGLDQALEWVEKAGLVETSPLTSAHGNSLDGTNFKMYAGNAPSTNTGYTFLATKENGQVKNGNYALGFTLDETSYNEYGSWEYNILFNVEGQTVLRDVKNGLNATTLGMWIYLPEDLIGTRYTGDQEGFAMQYQLYGGSSADNVAAFGGHFILQDTKKNLYSATGNVTETGRWVYMTADISSKDYVSLTNPQKNIWREPCFIRFYFKRLEANKYTFYYDDFTLDYSSAVEDRDAPIISEPKYSVLDNLKDFSIPCGQNNVLFSANIKEFAASNASGLDYSSAKIYVDGKALDNVTASGSTMTSGEVFLTNGSHEVIFEIADNMGTVTKNLEVLTITGDKPIWIAGHNDSGKLAEYDSIYYMDLKVADVAEISAVETEISLNHANKWELPFMTVAEGFTVDYKFVELTNSVKLTITKKAGCALTGTQTLVSIPVRTWSWPSDAYDVTSKAGLVKNIVTAATMSKAGGRPFAPIDFEVEYGVVTYSSDKYDGFLGAFYDFFTTETKIQDETYAWHLTHTVTALADVAATCTKDGYKGRTYCDVCQSIVDFGTIIPAKGHDYKVTDGVLMCHCGETFNGIYTDGKFYVDGKVIADGWNADGTKYYIDGVAVTGVKYIDKNYLEFAEDGTYIGKYTGKLFSASRNGYVYAAAGRLKTGWIMIDDVWHYFNPSTYVMATGTCTMTEGKSAGITYVFSEDGKLTNGVWHTYADGKTRYFYGPEYYNWSNNIMVEIDGKEYCFDKDGYLYRGYSLVKLGAFAKTQLYRFDDVTGEFYEIITNTGVYGLYDGTGCYVINGEVQAGLGMITIDGDSYYVRGDGTIAVGKFLIKAGYKGCSHLEPGYYDFGTDGKFKGPWVEPPFTGIKEDENGIRRYYKDDKVQYGVGLVTVDGARYFVTEDGLLATGIIWIEGEETLADGYYEFTEDGKFIGDWVEPPFTGVKADENGVYRYYVNDVVQKALGMITVDGDSYYVRGNGEVAVGKYEIKAGYKGCAHLAPGFYDFGTDGKFIGPWSEPVREVKADENGVYRYYIDGVVQKALGMITLDGYNYYVRGDATVAVGKFYIKAGYKGCSHLEPGYYDFGTDGKFVGPWGKFTGVKADENGVYRYYVDDVVQKALGMITVDGDSYYVRGNGEVAVGKYEIKAGYKGCAHLAPGFYNFGTDGKFIGPWSEPVREVKADENGVYRYYIDGVVQKALGMITLDGYNYYVRGNGEVAVGKYEVKAGYKGCSHLAPGFYDFGTDGKFVGPWSE